MRKQRILSLLFAALLSTVTISCDRAKRQMPQKRHKTITVEPSNSTIRSYYTASIRGEQFVELRPQVSGVITKILINEGAHVKKGQTLFIIDQTPYRAALLTAQANVKNAKANLATAQLNAKSRKELLEEEVISDYEHQTAENNLLSAKANLAQTQAQELNASNNLSYTTVKSPVNGVAGMISYRVGSLVNPSIADPLVDVSNDNTMHIYFSMSEAEIITLTRQNGSTQKLIENTPAIELILNDGSVYQHKGRVDAISGMIDQATGSVTLRAIFDNPEKMLRDGGSGRVAIDNKLQNVIVIPKEATFELQNKVFVYKAVDGKASATEVTVNPLNDGKKYVVLTGLNIGDEIIATGAGLVKEGALVGNKPQTKPQDKPQEQKQDIK